jgi:hypothetical protein
VAVALMVLFVWGARAGIGAAAVRAIAARDASRAGLVVFALLCQLQTLGRGDFAHLAQAAGPAFLCLGTVFTPQAVARRWGAGALGSLVAVLAIVAAFVNPSTPSASTLSASTPSASTPAQSYQTSVALAVAFIRQNTAQAEPIFVGLTSNRYTFINPLLVYYLADRAPGVRDTMYNPGITNRDTTQREMIADLDRSGTRYLVLDRVFASACEPFNASCQPGSSRLDEFIGSEFRTAADFGGIVVMVRR